VVNGVSDQRVGAQVRTSRVQFSRVQVELVSKERDTSDRVIRLLFSVGFLFVKTAFLMLGFDAAHGAWPSVPAVGYWTSFFLVLGLNTVGLSLFKPARLELAT